MPGKNKRRRFLALGLALSLVAAAWFLGILRLPNPKEGVKIEPYTVVRNGGMMESSGLVQSRSHPDIFWSHNDSGDVPRIFAIQADGNTPPGARGDDGINVENSKLVDWEDIAIDGERLFLCDLGNNFNRRSDLGVYEVPEPRLHQDPSVRAARFFPISYPDQTGYPPRDRWDFDCEAAFFWSGKLYVITKSRPAFRIYVQAQRAGLYRLDTQHTDKVNLLTKVDETDGLGGWVTSADTTQDGRFLAVLVESPVQSVWLYEKPETGDRFFNQARAVKRKVFHGAGQVEALCFQQKPDGTVTILLLNEGRQLFRLGLEEFTEP